MQGKQDREVEIEGEEETEEQKLKKLELAVNEKKDDVTKQVAKAHDGANKQAREHFGLILLFYQIVNRISLLAIHTI